MTLAASSVRALGALSAGLLALGMLSACTPEPAPKPTPSQTALFSSDAEAFKAAEETYRAYTDALNKVDTSDPHTFEPVLAYATGDFKAGDKKNLSIMHAEEYSMTGQTVVKSFTGVSTAGNFAEVVGSICLDVSQTDILDKSGASIVPESRPDRYTAIVTFTALNGALLISHAENDSEHSCEE